MKILPNTYHHINMCKSSFLLLVLLALLMPTVAFGQLYTSSAASNNPYCSPSTKEEGSGGMYSGSRYSPMDGASADFSSPNTSSWSSSQPNSTSAYGSSISQVGATSAPDLSSVGRRSSVRRRALGGGEEDDDGNQTGGGSGGEDEEKPNYNSDPYATPLTSIPWTMMFLLLGIVVCLRLRRKERQGNKA